MVSAMKYRYVNLSFSFLIIVMNGNNFVRSNFPSMLEMKSITALTLKNVYETFQRSYNFFRHDKYACCNLKFKRTKKFSYCNSDKEFRGKSLNIQRNFVEIQASRITSLTELSSILFVKYMSLRYAIKFVHGQSFFARKGHDKRAQMSMQLAKYLASFGVHATDNVIRAIRFSLLEQGQSGLNAERHFAAIGHVLRLFEKVINPETIYNNADSTGYFRDGAIVTGMSVLDKYFKSKLGIPEFEGIRNRKMDLEGDASLWNAIDDLYVVMRRPAHKLHKNIDTFTINMFRSSVADILLTAELYNFDTFSDPLNLDFQTILLVTLTNIKDSNCVLNDYIDGVEDVSPECITRFTIFDVQCLHEGYTSYNGLDCVVKK